MTDSPIILYRVDDKSYAGGVDEWGEPIPGDGSTEIRLSAYRVEKVTPKGWRLDLYGGRRFILKDARKRWACPTIEEAFASFDARRKRQASIYLARAKRALKSQAAAERLRDRLTERMLSHPSHHEGRGPFTTVVAGVNYLDEVAVSVRKLFPKPDPVQLELNGE